jgi:hypothetical protein
VQIKNEFAQQQVCTSYSQTSLHPQQSLKNTTDTPSQAYTVEPRSIVFQEDGGEKQLIRETAK